MLYTYKGILYYADIADEAIVEAYYMSRANISPSTVKATCIENCENIVQSLQLGLG